MKNRLALLACVLIAFHMGACTSNDSKEDDSVSEESMSGDESLEEVDGLDADNGDAPADGDMNAEVAPDTGTEGFTEDALTDSPEGDMSIAESSPEPVPDTGGEAFPAPETGFTDSVPPSDSYAESAPMSDSGDVAAYKDTPPSSESSSSSSQVFDSSPAKSFPVSSLKKAEATPFERDGVLLNAVYFARPGDSFSKVSKMIYQNTKKTKELRNVNPDVMPRIGDAIYYNSPVRPTDANVIKNYYEDAGLQPKVFIAGEGDDLKRVSKDALGFDGAWKEVWASNSVDSKGKLASGTELRYYSSNDVENAPPAQTMAQNEMAAPVAPDMGMTPPPDMGMPPAPDMGMPPDQMADMPAPPEMGIPPDQMADMPPPPPDMGMPPMDGSGDAMAGMNAPPPPPPEMAPLPPPPPSDAPQMAQKAEAGVDGSDNDVMMALGAAGGIAAILALLMVMRKRRQQREMAAAFGDTQVGT